MGLFECSILPSDVRICKMRAHWVRISQMRFIIEFLTCKNPKKKKFASDLAFVECEAWPRIWQMRGPAHIRYASFKTF